MRKSTKPKVDQKVFSRTAARSKAINLGVITYRGGIRF